MSTKKEFTIEEILAQYADNIVTLTEFDDNVFLAGHKTKSVKILLADKIIKKDLIYLVFDDKKIKHNFSFLSEKLNKMVSMHQNDLKNGYVDWFAIGTWICLFDAQIVKGKKQNGLQIINYTLDLDLLKKGQYLMVDKNILAELKKIQAKMLEIMPENDLLQYDVKTIAA
jgi:hypothetical protein